MEQENQPESNWAYNPGQSQETSTPTTTVQAQAITWSASEYISHEKSPMWYAYLASGATVLCAVVFLFTRDWIAVTVVAVTVLLLAIYSNRAPRTRSYVLDDKGLHIDNELHPFSKFRSFSIVEEGGISSIWLKPLKRISPVVVIYCAPDEEPNIVDALGNYLPHEQRELDQIDKISKQLRF